MTIFSAVILGLVQGLTEFLPVSSSGHLVIVHELFGTGIDSLSFDVLLHLATLLAVGVYFWKDLTSLCSIAFAMVRRHEVPEEEKKLVYALIVGTIPAGVLGALFASEIEGVFRSSFLVALALILGSVLFWYAERVHQRHLVTRSLSGAGVRREVDIKKGFVIGCFQALALIPGMSRSGATISGGLFLGLSREQAVRFSFLLSVPIILGAGLVKIVSDGELIFGVPALCGALAAFLSGLWAIHFLVKFLKNHTLMAFVWYRILLAVLILLFI